MMTLLSFCLTASQRFSAAHRTAGLVAVFPGYDEIGEPALHAARARARLPRLRADPARAGLEGAGAQALGADRRRGCLPGEVRRGSAQDQVPLDDVRLRRGLRLDRRLGVRD